MRQAYFVVGLLLGIAITIFAAQNTESVGVRFLRWQAQGPLAAVVLLSAVGGLLVALRFGLPEILTARWRIRALERQRGGTIPQGERPAPPQSPEPPAGLA